MALRQRITTVGMLFVLAGCGGAVPGSATQTGTVAGQVEVRACGGPPVDSPAPCIFRPMAGARVDLENGSRTVKSALTDAGGHYSVSVAPGAYIVHFVGTQSTAMTGDSKSVQVEPGQVVEADFDITFQAA